MATLDVRFTGKNENRGGQSGVGTPCRCPGVPTNTGGAPRSPLTGKPAGAYVIQGKS
jgi:hypothetical protein